MWLCVCIHVDRELFFMVHRELGRHCWQEPSPLKQRFLFCPLLGRTLWKYMHTAPQRTINPLPTFLITMVAVTTPTCHLLVTWPQGTEEAVVTLCHHLPLRTFPWLPPWSKVLLELVVLVLPLALWPATSQDLLYPLSLLIVTAHWVSLASLNHVLISIVSLQLCNLMFEYLVIVNVFCMQNVLYFVFYV